MLAFEKQTKHSASMKMWQDLKVTVLPKAPVLEDYLFYHQWALFKGLSDYCGDFIETKNRVRVNEGA
jgi:hypothetical protein